MAYKRHVLMFMVVLGLAALARAQTFNTLYNFTGGTDGYSPVAGVIQDPAGNLYGTTPYGGDLNCEAGVGCGVVYEMNTSGTETALHTFSGPDGLTPVTPLTRDKAGNIYGTTGWGGSGPCPPGCGTVFKIDTAGNETVLYNFTGGPDGCHPLQGLIMDRAGNLYGTTEDCGASRLGTVFKIDSAGNETILHSFAGPPSDAAGPEYGHLVMDKSGNLYGVAPGGGAYGDGYGALYKLSNKGTLTLLHSFDPNGKDGYEPFGSVVLDEAGSLYGTTSFGGSNGGGTVWKVTKKGKETLLHNFAEGSSDGCSPYAGVARDPKGNLYGVTTGCGASGNGVLYELSANGTLTLLHSFDYYTDGTYPLGEVLRTAKGTLFGSTEAGGGNCYYGCGTVWSYVP